MEQLLFLRQPKLWPWFYYFTLNIYKLYAIQKLVILLDHIMMRFILFLLIINNRVYYEDEATNDPDGSEDCLPKNSQGRYVMHGSPNSGYEKNNYNFSPCSIRSIQRTLYELASKCFVEEKIAFCGNGILEKGRNFYISFILSKIPIQVRNVMLEAK